MKAIVLIIGILGCLITSVNASTDLMDQFITKYRNLITYNRLNQEEQILVRLVQKAEALPTAVLTTLKSLELSLLDEWDPGLFTGKSYYVINFSTLPNESDAMVVQLEGEIFGYIFNVTECNEQECYGWDALYLDSKGVILKQTF